MLPNKINEGVNLKKKLCSLSWGEKHKTLFLSTYLIKPYFSLLPDTPKQLGRSTDDLGRVRKKIPSICLQDKMFLLYNKWWTKH